MTFVLGSVIWFLAFISPKIFQVIFQMIGVKGSEADENLPIKNENAKNQIKQAPSNQETVSEEQSDSEKLRNEFKNRKLV